HDVVTDEQDAHSFLHEFTSKGRGTGVPAPPARYRISGQESSAFAGTPCTAVHGSVPHLAVRGRRHRAGAGGCGHGGRIRVAQALAWQRSIDSTRIFLASAASPQPSTLTHLPFSRSL